MKNENAAINKIVKFRSDITENITDSVNALLIKLALRFEDGLNVEEEEVNKLELLELVEEIKKSDTQIEVIDEILDSLGVEIDKESWRSKRHEYQE